MDYKETKDLATLPAANKKIYMRSLDFSTLKINGENASVQDITAAGAPTKSQWRIYFDLRAADVDTPGEWLINFPTKFSDDVTLIHPDGGYLVLPIVRALS